MARVFVDQVLSKAGSYEIKPRLIRLGFYIEIIVAFVTFGVADGFFDTANAAVPPVTLSQVSLSFGNQFINTTSASQSVIVTNNQSVALNFSSIRTFSPFQQTNTCGSSIPGNSSCTVTVVFRPRSLGAVTTAVRLINSASNSPQYINLSGNGTAATPAVSILTYHYNNNRTGANTHETILTPANVNQAQFGKLFSLPTDGGIYAQPLYVPNLHVPGLGTHNVIYVATQHDWLYAFDADNGSTLWADNLGPYQPTPQGCQEPGDVGIIGTPVIDRSSNTLYAIAATLQSGQPAQELHALDITTGGERSGSPVLITASVPGTGFGSSGGILTFNPLYQFQRPALLLDNGTLYIGFASHCDGSFDADGHGWLIAYNASTLQQKGSFVVSPNGYGGGMWMSGGGPAADANHNLYFSTGNGNFDVNQGGIDYGDSVIKLSPNGPSLLDYFTPFNQVTLEVQDGDLGSGGTLLLPDQSTSPAHLLVTAGKQGRVYLINRDNLGKYNSTFDNVVEFQIVITGLFSTPSSGTTLFISRRAEIIPRHLHWRTAVYHPSRLLRLQIATRSPVQLRLCRPTAKPMVYYGHCNMGGPPPVTRCCTRMMRLTLPRNCTIATRLEPVTCQALSEKSSKA